MTGVLARHISSLSNASLSTASRACLPALAKDACFKTGIPCIPAASCIDRGSVCFLAPFVCFLAPCANARCICTDSPKCLASIASLSMLCLHACMLACLHYLASLHETAQATPVTHALGFIYMERPALQQPIGKGVCISSSTHLHSSTIFIIISLSSARRPPPLLSSLAALRSCPRVLETSASS